MKKILILDDQKVRHQKFADQLRGNLLHHAFNVGDFKSLVNTHSPYDLIFLDHDLGAGQEDKNLTTIPTGADAVKLLAGLPKDRQPQGVVVHSINTPAALRMVADLQDAGIKAKHAPFSAK